MKEHTKRTVHCGLRLRTSERDAIEAAADAVRLSLSEFIRESALGAARRVLSESSDSRRKRVEGMGGVEVSDEPAG
jgi:uncharacterized protein (DUF1778 family)